MVVVTTAVEFIYFFLRAQKVIIISRDIFF